MKWLAVLLLLITPTVWAQTYLELNYTSGSLEYFELDSISSIAFSDSTMLVNDLGRTFSIHEIRSMRFMDQTTSTEANIGVNHCVSIFPNPANPSVSITINLALKGQTSIALFTVGGQAVKTLVNGVKNKGMQKVVWDGTDALGRQVASGHYIVCITIKNKTIVRKISIVR
ncbi:MAG: hypothetical protein A2268_06460 [Candidatus Raymondbacteria bacterium RifOxyA12_full_50_37]|uniref:FlgD/Vpr Ig-like domain-containing protein n=1 Tax=Candidatus Raymondbacteria bacterium RIFOXYD12_FULL_49_13 TaxID=1817890 RepID=A0A1F7EZJ4_UNCRA|nr:MAG: hypothetical protein A2268_06460 [Candidatus Raymondbacteria bacterium RifOxyA12_full_50_37]OGJ92668.1 MAG: hypothetical protein A2350_03965 [Candidatus Raymondbacteria bacterium RifOxyB12_full_50_8]OGJ94454.1 MAG: hypothetical protein A2248_15390 [Candidatus Raymondbacteria bacterium RIFOXYA2_FULL_49_16]OGJ99210.1 MAG: hypothetical protein A2453_07240 [Candidatus Raymondbacteria bacterium RIFOXYC2_FULL_50_21]OGJ99781.1 MAG: hypothetical protein A2519_12620 [Candidatus Raymondbacteria b